MGQVEPYRAVIIGAGQAGKPLALELAHAGWMTALVEREHIGGTCINVGCTPTKTMVASARVAYLAGRGADYGVRSEGVTVDMARVRERKRAIVESFRGGGQRRLERTDNLTLLFGEASFTAPRELEVRMNVGGTRRLAADVVIVDTGCRPARPPLAGLEAVPSLDSTSVMELGDVPRHLLVIGGGYIGLEFGQMFRRFGADVSIVQRPAQLVEREDADVADELTRILRGDGIEVLLGAEALRVGRVGDDSIELVVRTRGGERRLIGSHLLVAAGRVPNTERLNLAAAGVEANPRGYIRVNERLETSAPGVFATGDVNGGPAFTHIAYDDYRVLRENLLRGGAATTRDRLVPYAVFVDPELARVGLSERDARERGLDVRVAKMPMSWVARALEMDETHGFMKAVVDARSKLILGYTVLGVGGGELMAVVQMAMMGRLPYPVLKDAIFVHPTMAESLNNLFAQLDA